MPYGFVRAVEIKGGGVVMLSVDYFTLWRMQYQCKRNFEAVAGCRKGWGIILISFYSLYRNVQATTKVLRSISVTEQNLVAF